MSEQDRPEVQQDVQDAWSALVATALRSVEDGLVVGTSGNVSVRVGDLVTVLVPEDPLQPGVPGNTMTQARLLDLARVAAGRMCAAANPGC